MNHLKTHYSFITTVPTDWLQALGITPSQDPDHPTHLGPEHLCMVACGKEFTASHHIRGILHLAAPPIDAFRFHMTSEYHNFQNPVIQYKLEVIGHAHIKPHIYPDAPVPQPKSFSPLTIETGEQYISFFEADLHDQQHVQIRQSFAVYLNQRGMDAPQLWGYFVWEPTIKRD